MLGYFSVGTPVLAGSVYTTPLDVHTTTLREFSVNMVGKIIDFTGQTGMNEVWTCSFAPVARYVFTSTRKLKTGSFVEKWLRWKERKQHLVLKGYRIFLN